MQDKNVVIRWQNEFKDGKQKSIGPGDAIDICALEGSINVVSEDMQYAEFVRIKKDGRCDKSSTENIAATPNRNGNTGNTGNYGFTGAGGTFRGSDIVSGRNVDEPGLEQTL